MRTVTAHGRWIWGLSGLATAAVLAVPGARLLTHPGADAQHVTPANTATRTISLAQPITSLDVQSQDGSVRVQAGPGRGVHIIELISYDKSVSPPRPGWRTRSPAAASPWPTRSVPPATARSASW